MFVLHVSKIYNFSRLINSIFIPNCLFSLAIGFFWGAHGECFRFVYLFIGGHLILFFPPKFIKKCNDNTYCKSGRGVLYVSPVLSVCQYGLSVRGLGLVLVVSRPSKAGRPLDTDKSGCIKSCRGGETDPDFSRPFLWIFVPDPRLLQPTLES